MKSPIARLLAAALLSAACSSPEPRLIQAPAVEDVASTPDTSGNDAVTTADTSGHDVPHRPDLGGQDIGPDAPGIEDAAFGLDLRPVNATCHAWARPASGSSVEIVRAFANLSFSQPIWMTQAPHRADRWYVVEQAGRVRIFDNDEATSEVATFADIRQRVTSGGERGLLGLAFHPQFETNGQVFFSYTAGNQSRISRFVSTDAGTTIDHDSETILLTISQPYANHNGGQIGFGPDGYLYIGMGDGGSSGDPLKHGQNTDTLLGAMLRIDIDGTAPYAIPSDNPFVEGGGAPEIFAWGLRNPWRWSFDRETGELWAGDVGQNAVEEVSIIRRGGNYGWSAKEGFRCHDVNPCDSGEWLDPVVDYGRQNGDLSITGGYVYRGQAIASLIGTYVYADFVSGRIWALLFDAESGAPRPAELLRAGFNVASFAESKDGELYVLNHGGSIHRLMPAGEAVADPVPARLSLTGCVQPNDVRQPAAGLVPYDVNAPLWSDGADKRRFLALPDGKTIDVASDGNWVLPQGSVLIKHFVLGTRFIETRFLVRHDDGGWAGYTYEWNEAQTEATLLAGSKTKMIDGQRWSYPGRAECTTCHTQAAGVTLGLETAQLNAGFVYPTLRRANQLATFEHIGLLSAPLGALPEALPALADPHGTGALAARASAYMHANCAQCHRPDGPTPSEMDLRYDTELGDRNICDVLPSGRTLGEDARLLAPGSASLSLIAHRMQTLDAYRMPPIGSHLVDDQGTALIEAWIEALQACP
ncbi:MAG: PQQ-dependent sugar dehydrogenase [Bradymonadaceae bacterium]|nr:PQQ-dependent sugar dehydrogenase [Lujinxingiaceae bacterium]